MSDYTILPKSRIVRVEFEVVLPEEAEATDVLEWICHNLNHGAMRGASPLAMHSLDTVKEPTLTDTGLHLHEKAVRSADGTGWAIHRRREQSPFVGPSGMDVVRFDSIAAEEDVRMEPFDDGLTPSVIFRSAAGRMVVPLDHLRGLLDSIEGRHGTDSRQADVLRQALATVDGLASA